MDWSEGPPTEPGPYWLQIKFKSGYVDKVLTYINKNINGDLFICNSPTLFNDYVPLNDKGFRIIKHCRISEPKGQLKQEK